MDLKLLHQKLLAAARRVVPSERVPFAFEKRVMARLSGKTISDPWAAWGVLLWRALTPCCAVMLIVGVSSLTVSQPSDEDSPSQVLDAVLLAGLDSVGDAP